MGDRLTNGERRQRWGVVGLASMAAAGAVSLVGMAALGAFSRYLADDYCTAGTLREMGFLGSQAYWYETWSGRFSFTLLISLTHLVGPRLTPWLPALLLALAAGALAWLARRLCVRAGIDAGWVACAAISATCLAAVLAAAPNLYQSVFWQTGLITYFVPLILVTAHAGWLARRSAPESEPGRRLPGLLAGFLIPFFAGGFSETFVSVQTVGIAGALGAAVLLGRGESRRRIAPLLVSGLLGSLMALTIVALAPGNAARAGLMPEPPGLGLLLQRTWQDTYVFGARMVRGQPLSLAAPFAAAYAVTLAGLPGGRPMGRERWRAAWRWCIGGVAAGLGALGMVAAAMAPSEYALSAYPDGRIVFTAVYVTVLAAALGGAILGRVTRLLLPEPSARLAGVLSLLAAMALVTGVSLGAVRSGLGLLEDARGFAASWDARDASIHAALARGENDLPVASLTHMAGLDEVSRDPDDWVNRCLADAYGLKRVTAK